MSLPIIVTKANAQIQFPVALRKIDPNLTGKTVNIAVISRSITYIDGQPQNDYLPDISHISLAEKSFIFHDQNHAKAGFSPHATAVCSILFGNDPNAYDYQLGHFDFQGIIPDANASVYEFWHFLIEHVFTQSPCNADVITASMGSPFEDWWTRGIDRLATDNGPVIVAGIGNGFEVHDPILYPAGAANVIGVGVVDSVNAPELSTVLSYSGLALPEHSSCGPTAEGRSKPDIVANGNMMAAVSNSKYQYETTGSWSSYATPVVAATAAMLIDKAKLNPNLTLALPKNGGNIAIKAILMNSATKLPYWHKGDVTTADDHNVPLDFIQGAGMLDPKAAYYLLTSSNQYPGNVNNIGWNINSAIPVNSYSDSSQPDPYHPQYKKQNTYTFAVPNPKNKTFTATLVWNKNYEQKYPFEPMPQLDADLKLELWAYHPNTPQQKILIDYSDSSIDNVEHIYTPTDPNLNIYELVVTNQTDLTEPNYAIAWQIQNAPKFDNILRYDLNIDGIVNQADLTMLIHNVLSGLTYNRKYVFADVNIDGCIDVNDLTAFMVQLNKKAQWLKK